MADDPKPEAVDDSETQAPQTRRVEKTPDEPKEKQTVTAAEVGELDIAKIFNTSSSEPVEGDGIQQFMRMKHEEPAAETPALPPVVHAMGGTVQVPTTPVPIQKPLRSVQIPLEPIVRIPVEEPWLMVGKKVKRVMDGHIETVRDIHFSGMFFNSEGGGWFCKTKDYTRG